MVTIIIPIYNEEKNIGRLERNLKALKGEFEVIFSDGFSRDKSFEKITFPKIREARYRSNQMNAGAQYGKGEYLWFVHGDSVLDEDSVLAIQNSGAEVGCFTLEFDWNHPLMKMVAFNSSNRVRFRNIAFGDQGIFIKRDIFENLGGFKSIPLMEDYQLSMDLKERGYQFTLLNKKIRTSARRFREKGIWPMIFKMQLLQHRYRRKKDIQKIHQDYGD